MESINVTSVYGSLKRKYLSFVLTTICRSNNLLKEKLIEIFHKEPILSTDIILSTIPKYKVSSENKIAEINLNKKLMEYIFKKDINNGKIPYVHQVNAWNQILLGKNCIISSGTSSGKTESFFYPIIDYCIKNPSKGVKAILIYPTKALSNNHAERFGEILDEVNKFCETNLSFGLLDSETNDRDRIKNNFYSEIKTKQEIISNKPDILMTNYAMLERLLIEPKYKELFQEHKIKFLVLDEIHYYRGSQGIDVSLLIRRAKSHLDISCVQCIGTSATLGEESEEETKKFLYKIFSSRFEEKIIRPEFQETNDDNLSTLLKRPKKMSSLIAESKLSVKEIEDILEKSKNLRAHIFFQSPTEMSRCLNCGNLSKGYSEKCKNCSSNLIFELLTCRQCGQEYFNYLFEKDTNTQTLNTRLDSFIRWSQEKNTKKYKELVLTLKKPKEGAVSFKLCKSCSNLYPYRENSCPDCNKGEHLEVFAPQEKEDIVNPQEFLNNKYCPECNFKNISLPLILPTEISDENCSHIIFDELYSVLPKGRDKILIFTDGVQRSSKFARELEETHIKNIARAKLEEKLNKTAEKINLSMLIFQIIDDLKNDFPNFSKDLEEEIKIELYEEIFSNENKVASLKNRGKISLSYDLSNITGDVNPYSIFLDVLFENLHVREYYDILARAEERGNFLDRKQLFIKLYRRIKGFKGKKGIDESEAFNFSKTIADSMCGFNLLEYDSQTTMYFIKPRVLLIQGVLKEESDNYYEQKSREILKLMRTENHTGKTDVKQRQDIEEEFQKEDSNINILVATPTLELGIDIGVLDSVGLLFAPPSPASYIQRVGRAGRRGSSALSVCFLGKRPVDSTYFREPESLVEGKIMPPCYKIELEIPLKKSLYSIYLRHLLNSSIFEEKLKEDLKSSAYWIRNFKEIKEAVISIKDKSKKFLEEIILSDKIYQSFNSEELIKEWIEKVQMQIEIENSIERYQDEQEDIYSLLKRAGVLPDYAFGTGGIILKKGYYERSIKGFRIDECCPPSTLDKDKCRYKCEKISPVRNAKKVLSPNSYSQCSCGASTSFKNANSCQFCNGEMLDRNKVIVEPKVIEIKRSTFRLNKKYISWKYSLIDPPNFLKKDSFISLPNDVEILEFAEGYRESGKNYEKDPLQIKICKNCGLFMGESTSLSCIQGKKHEADNFTIGTKFKTRAIELDLSNLDKTSIANKTLLNALISALTIKSGCEDGELEGILPTAKTLIIFDNVEGGVGFVDYLNENPLEVLNEALHLCRDTTCCDLGCVKCIGSYRRQWEINELNKKSIIPLLEEMIKINNERIKNLKK